MTEISFHFNVPQPAVYACRLLRKAVRQGAAVVVTADAAALDALDRTLWSFDPVEFLPHLVLRPGPGTAAATAAPGVAGATRIWLTEHAPLAPCHEVLVNLGSTPPEGFESYARLIEIVSNAEDERAAARLRWKHYASRGYAIQRHEVAD